MPEPLATVAFKLLLAVTTSAVLRSAFGQQERHHGHEPQPVPFAYCKPYLERLSNNDQHQLRESYQEYHAAYARYMRASRNKEAFEQGAPTWMETEEQKRAWHVTYIAGNNLANLTATLDDAKGVMETMENRIKAELKQLETAGKLPGDTGMDDLSPCLMRKIYPSHFPDQPTVSLLLRLRGDVPNPADWPPSNPSTPEPPQGKGPEGVAAFIARARQCSKVAPLELIVMLSGAVANKQATTWAWQSWQSEGFVVPILDTLDREAHALNRMASVARGSVLVALRSDQPLVDDLFQDMSDCLWLQRILTLYHRIPALGGMTHGRFSFSYPSGTQRLLGPVPDAAGPTNTNMFFKERMTSVPFQYALYGDYMPMSFRRSALEEVGGFDEDLPQGSDPCASYIRMDLCLRLWKSGWRVGAHDAGLLQQPVSEQGTAANNEPNRCSPDVAKLAAELVEARHIPPALLSEAGGTVGGPPPLEVLKQRVRLLNMDKLVPLGPGALDPCPMEQGC